MFPVAGAFGRDAVDVRAKPAAIQRQALNRSATSLGQVQQT